MGCNTSCAVAAQRGWPVARIPILDLIDAAAEAVAATDLRRVGVLATAATTSTGAYGDAIRRAAPHTAVEERAAPKLVPLVEAGILAGPVVHAAVAEACARFAAPLDALVLACTHYPLLGIEFASVLGARVRLIDPAFAQADRALRFAQERATPGGTGATAYVTTGTLESYRTAVEAIVGTIRTGDTFVHAPLSLART